MSIIYIRAEKIDNKLHAVTDSHGKIECTYSKEFALKNFINIIALHDCGNVKERALRYHTHKGL